MKYVYVYTQEGETRARELGFSDRRAGRVAFCGREPLTGSTAKAWEKKGYVIRKEVNVRTCASLKENEDVVFKVWDNSYNRKVEMDGTVISVDEANQTVTVVYLDGYKSETENVPFGDMLAVYNKDGALLQFDAIRGPSDLLDGGEYFSGRRRTNHEKDN